MTPAAPTHTAAFFDVDGTLCDTTIAHYFRYFMFRRLSPLVARLWYPWFLAKCCLYLLLDKFDRERLNVVFYRNYRGLPIAEITSQAADCFHDVIMPRIFPQGESCVAEHRNAGMRIVLVTGSLDFIVDPLRGRLGAHDLLAAGLSEAHGRFTGELIGPPIGGEEKARVMRVFAEKHGLDLAHSHAYGDSGADLPMLEAVGFPHVVNPDRRLSALATERGWPIHRWSVETQGADRGE